MTKLKLNCDLGESDVITSGSIEHKIMPFIDMANVACGGHAGNKQTMCATINLAKQHNVEVGAHPSYPDKKNFGRVSINMPAEQFKESIIKQLNMLIEVATHCQYSVSYVKAHGALYNDMAQSASLAALFFECIEQINIQHCLNLNVMIIAHSIKRLSATAQSYNLTLIPEAFSDRRYTDKGLLTARTNAQGHPNQDAVLGTEETVFQAISVAEQWVMTNMGMPLPISADSLCVHGDNVSALESTQLICDINKLPFSCVRSGPNSLLFKFSEEVSRSTMIRLGTQLTERFSTTLLVSTPAFKTLFLESKPGQLDAISILKTAMCLFKNLLTEQHKNHGEESAVVTLPVYYGKKSEDKSSITDDNNASDIDTIAQQTGHTVDEIVALHQASAFTVEAIGFAPGFAYLSGLPDSLSVPRHATPRSSVPQGSVAIAQSLTCIYPTSSPGGWNIIGRCPIPLFQPLSAQPLLYRIGDQVRFEAIDEQEYTRLSRYHAESQHTDSIYHHGLPSTVSALHQPALEVVKANTSIIVQDDGRQLVGHLGLTTGGAADKYAFYWANKIIGNNVALPALEILFGQCQFKSLKAQQVCITGADVTVLVNGKSVPMWASITLKKHDVVKIGFAKQGLRVYLALQGGVAAPEFEQSVSTVTREQIGTTVTNNDILAVIKGEAQRSKNNLDTNSRQLSSAMIPDLFGPTSPHPMQINLYISDQQHEFTTLQLDQLLSNSYEVSPTSDRMGVRLIAPNRSLQHNISIASEGIGLGAVQIPPNGDPIIMLADRQTIGGYPKIGTIVPSDCYRLAQAAPGTRVTFNAVTLKQALATKYNNPLDIMATH